MLNTNDKHFLDGGGRMGHAIRAFDWASTPLGPMEQWPASLRIAVGMMVNSRFPKCIAWGPELITLYNDAFQPILGDKPEALGRSFRDVWAEAWDYVGPLVEKAFSGEPEFIENFPLIIDRYGYPEQAYFTFCYSPIRDQRGEIVGMMDTIIETTGTVEAERQARIVNAELAHRMKNTLAIVSAIVSQTLRAADTKDDAQVMLSQRLAALGHAHTMLTQSHRGDAPIRTVIHGALKPHLTDGREVLLDGLPVNLSARQALSLALAINELATNAIKYGALSVDEGEVQVTWEAGTPESDEPFRLVWRERNGPPVTPPARRGFGTRLITDVLARDFNGTVDLVYAPEGVTCTLTTAMFHLDGGE